jgi:hypothetical protein
VGGLIFDVAETLRDQTQHCRAELDEEAKRCPKCGMYVSEEDAPRERKSAAWVVVMVLALLLALVWVLGR